MITLFRRTTLGGFALIIALSIASAAQELDDRGKIAEILSELKAIHALLERGQGARPLPSRHIFKISVKDVPYLGSKDALFAIAELTDYECTYCRQFYLETFQKIQQQMIATNKVRFYVKNLPLDIHPNALLAAQAASCAADQGRFWEMHDAGKLLVAVHLENGVYIGAPSIGSDNLGREYRVTVPAGIPLRLWLFSRDVRLTDSDGKPISSPGNMLAFKATAEKDQSFVFNVSGT